MKGIYRRTKFYCWCDRYYAVPGKKCPGCKRRQTRKKLLIKHKKKILDEE
jgi:hypothetical protein